MAELHSQSNRWGLVSAQVIEMESEELQLNESGASQAAFHLESDELSVPFV